jgi:hypothetical protein
MKNSYIWKNRKKKMEENWNMHGDNITNMLTIVMENNMKNNIMQCFSLTLKTSFCEKYFFFDK